MTYRVDQGAPPGRPYVVRLALAGGIVNNAPTDRYYRTDVTLTVGGGTISAGLADQDEGTYEPLAYARRASATARNGGGDERGEEALIPAHPSARLLLSTETVGSVGDDTFQAFDETFVDSPVTGCRLDVTEVVPPNVDEPLVLGP